MNSYYVVAVLTAFAVASVSVFAESGEVLKVTASNGGEFDIKLRHLVRRATQQGKSIPPKNSKPAKSRQHKKGSTKPANRQKLAGTRTVIKTQKKVSTHSGNRKNNPSRPVPGRPGQPNHDKLTNTRSNKNKVIIPSIMHVPLPDDSRVLTTAGPQSSGSTAAADRGKSRAKGKKLDEIEQVVNILGESVTLPNELGDIFGVDTEEPAEPLEPTETPETEYDYPDYEPEIDEEPESEPTEEPVTDLQEKEVEVAESPQSDIPASSANNSPNLVCSMITLVGSVMLQQCF